MEISINILDTFPSIEKIEKDNDLYIAINKIEYSIKKLIKNQEKIRFYYTDNQTAINLYAFSSANNTKIHLGSNYLNLAKIIEIINIDKKPYIIWLTFAKELKWTKETPINSNIFFYDNIRLKTNISINKIYTIRVNNSKVMQRMKDKTDERFINNKKFYENKKLKIDKKFFRGCNIKNFHGTVSYSCSNNNSKDKKNNKKMKKNSISPINTIEKYFIDKYYDEYVDKEKNSYIKINSKNDKNNRTKNDEFLNSNKNVLRNSYSVTQGNITNITINDFINSSAAIANKTCRTDNSSYIKKINNSNSGKIKNKFIDKKLKETIDNINNTIDNKHKNNVSNKKNQNSKQKYIKHSRSQFNSLKYMPFKENYNQENQIINCNIDVDAKINYSNYNKFRKGNNKSITINKFINIDDLIIYRNKNKEDAHINNDKEVNLEKFYSLKKDYELLYSIKFIKNIKNDLLFLDLNMAMDKTMKLILEYNTESKKLYNENFLLNKKINNFMDKLKYLDKKYYLLQKNKQSNEYKNQKMVINKEINFILDQNIETNKTTHIDILNNLYEKNSHKIKLKNIFDSIINKKKFILNGFKINKNRKNYSSKNSNEIMLNNKDEPSFDLKINKFKPKKKDSKEVIGNVRQLLNNTEDINNVGYKTIYSRNSFYTNQNTRQNSKIKVNTYFPNNSNNLSKSNKKFLNYVYSSSSQNNKNKHHRFYVKE